MWQKIKNFVVKHERRLSSVALVLGFIIDSLTLRGVDFYLENTALVSYIVIIALSTILINLAEGEGNFRRLLAKFHPIFLIAMQFSLGSLWSAFLIFYARSASLSASWPFLLLLLVQLLGNELLKERYTRLRVQIILLYFVIFSYSIFFVPVLVKQIGEAIFILSGIISLVVITILIKLFKIFFREKIVENRRGMIIGISGVFVLINVLYFSNIIPPIPLSLKDAGAYHSITRNGDGSYTVGSEQSERFDFLQWYQIIHARTGETIYFWSAVYAPTQFGLNIIHDWEYYDELEGKWQEYSSIPLYIAGGRQEGFRTYSEKTGLATGLWRVTVKTENGQIIGREKFRVQEVSVTPNLIPIRI